MYAGACDIATIAMSVIVCIVIIFVIVVIDIGIAIVVFVVVVFIIWARCNNPPRLAKIYRSLIFLPLKQKGDM